MRSLLVALAVAALLVAAGAAAATGGPAASAASNDAAGIASVFPNPTAPEDRGESVALAFDRPTNLTGWTLADGEGRVALPNRTVDGRAVLTRNPDAAVATRPDATVLPVDGLALANAGETLVLRDGERVVDRATYADAPAGEAWNATAERWWPVGASRFEPTRTGPTQATAFVLPDAPAVPVETLRRADDRLLLAGYTFTSRRAARALRRAAERGVRVAVLVEGEPVGGVSRAQVTRLDALAETANVSVHVLGGPDARYAYHHAKYAVVDDQALVLTENWKPAGTGGRSSRGWGAVVHDATVADALARTFAADVDGRDVRRWSAVRDDVDPVAADASSGTYPARVAPETVPVASAELLLAPDNAGERVPAVLRNASREVLVEQVTLGGRDARLTAALLAAARRGVRVRVLLSGAWYAREDNARRVAWLNDLADREGLDLRARLVDPRGRFEKVHAKGVVVDDRVLLGSLNWNDHALTENREVVLVLRGEAVADYYREVFRADWRGGTTRVPLGLALAVGLALAAAWLVGRRIRFEERATEERAADGTADESGVGVSLR